MSLSLDLRLALRGDLERVVSKSMLGQLEQYEIVKGQIWQQYYSSIEEKVKSDWFMNLYKTINTNKTILWQALEYCLYWNWHRLTVLRKISQNWCFISKKVALPQLHIHTITIHRELNIYVSSTERVFRTSMFLYNMFSRGQAEFSNSSHSQVHLVWCSKYFNTYENWYY